MFLKTFIIYREFPTRIAAAAVFSRCVLNQGNPHFNRVIFYLHEENVLVFSKVLRCLTEQYLQILPTVATIQASTSHVYFPDKFVS